jgi:DsbC/DsbD-like thiol-disulfide interchange protein
VSLAFSEDEAVRLRRCRALGKGPAAGLTGPAAMLGLALALGCSHAGDPVPSAASGDHLQVRLICREQALIPGSTAHFGISFRMDPGWHLYANGRSDSGLPPSVKPALPSGFQALSLLWPAPSRLVSPGEIVDQVYADRVTLILPVSVPAGLRAGTRETIRCRIEWLVCGTGCIPGSADLALTLPAARPGDPARESPEAPLIFEAMSRVPRPLPAEEGQIVQAASPSRWTVQVPGATALVFFPADSCATLADPLHDPVSNSDRLSVAFAEDPSRPQEAAGVLEVRQGDRSSFYTVRTPLRTQGPPNKTTT